MAEERERQIIEEISLPQRKLVIPGELLGTGRAGHGSYVENGQVWSKYVGLAEDRNGLWIVIPLCGVYNPKRGDGVIGKVADIIVQKWFVDINCPYSAVLTLSEGVEEFVDLAKADLTKFYDYGDIIFAEIIAVTKTKQVQLTMRSRKCRKLKGGRLIKVTPAKVPRIIGKAGSMVEMIKQLTGTQIVVGQNGIVWIKGDNDDLAAEAIVLIDQLAHVRGLTDYIKGMLEEKLKKAEIRPLEKEEELRE